MRYALLAGTLTVALGACSGGGPGDPAGPPVSPPDPPPDPRPQIGTWTALADLPQARTELSATALDGLVYVAGGLVAGPSEPVFRYDPAADVWSELAPLPAARHHAPLASHDGTVYVVGGYDLRASDVSPFGTPTDTLLMYDVERFDPGTGTWQEVAPMPSARHGLGAVALRDGILVIGGGPGVGLTYSASTAIWRP